VLDPASNEYTFTAKIEGEGQSASPRSSIAAFRGALSAEGKAEQQRWLMTLGWTYFTSGAFMHAEAMFRRARAIDPTVRNADILNGLGWSLNNRGQHREAEEVFLEGLRINPRQGAILNGLQSLSTARGDYASAKQHVRAWIAAAPDWMFARALLVRVHRLGGELDAAQTALEEASRPPAATPGGAICSCRRAGTTSARGGAPTPRRSSSAPGRWT
jgi:Flp pilus assembly protein TadD